MTSAHSQIRTIKMKTSNAQIQTGPRGWEMHRPVLGPLHRQASVLRKPPLHRTELTNEPQQCPKGQGPPQRLLPSLPSCPQRGAAPGPSSPSGPKPAPPERSSSGIREGAEIVPGGWVGGMVALPLRETPPRCVPVTGVLQKGVYSQAWVQRHPHASHSAGAVSVGFREGTVGGMQFPPH